MNSASSAPNSPKPKFVSDPSGCAITNPVMLKNFGASIKLQSEAVLDCPMALAAVRFMRDVAAPLAKRDLGFDLTSVNQASAYVCRSRNGTRKLSKHAFGNALDIACFGLTDTPAHRGQAGAVDPKNEKFLDGLKGRLRSVQDGAPAWQRRRPRPAFPLRSRASAQWRDLLPVATSASLPHFHIVLNAALESFHLRFKVILAPDGVSNGILSRLSSRIAAANPGGRRKIFAACCQRPIAAGPQSPPARRITCSACARTSMSASTPLPCRPAAACRSLSPTTPICSRPRWTRPAPQSLSKSARLRQWSSRRCLPRLPKRACPSMPANPPTCRQPAVEPADMVEPVEPKATPAPLFAAYPRMEEPAGPPPMPAEEVSCRRS